MTDRTCGNCRYWVKDDVKDDPDTDDDMHVGECRRYPPQVIHIVEQVDVATVWPVVGDMEWCGEWVAAVWRKYETQQESNAGAGK